jgi:hypothetical protein
VEVEVEVEMSAVSSRPLSVVMVEIA